MQFESLFVFALDYFLVKNLKKKKKTLKTAAAGAFMEV